VHNTGPLDYFAALQQVPDDTDTVLVIGHNPGLETIVQLLSGEVVALPTGAVAYIKLPIKKWSILTADIDGHLKELWRPKETK
jgi:phosphohistidine phosphatase